MVNKNPSSDWDDLPDNWRELMASQKIETVKIEVIETTDVVEEQVEIPLLDKTYNDVA